VICTSVLNKKHPFTGVSLRFTTLWHFPKAPSNIAEAALRNDGHYFELQAPAKFIPVPVTSQEKNQARKQAAAA
jgi:hypothetical protein